MHLVADLTTPLFNVVFTANQGSHEGPPVELNVTTKERKKSLPWRVEAKVPLEPRLAGCKGVFVAHE